MKKNCTTKTVKTAVIEPSENPYLPYKLVWRYGKYDFRNAVFETFEGSWGYVRHRLNVKPEMITDYTGQACTMELD